MSVESQSKFWIYILQFFFIFFHYCKFLSPNFVSCNSEKSVQCEIKESRLRFQKTILLWKKNRIVRNLRIAKGF